MKAPFNKLLNRFVISLTLILALAWLSVPRAVYAREWDKLPQALRLPKLDTDEEILAFINGIQEIYPGIFQGAVQYDVNLIQLVRDQKSLLEKLLEAHPAYQTQFEGRSLFDLDIRPAREGIKVEGTRLNPTALLNWRNNLALQLQGLDRSKSPSGALQSELHRLFDELLPKWKWDRAKLLATQAYTPILELVKSAEFVDFFRKTVAGERDVGRKVDLVCREVGQRLAPGGEAIAMQRLGGLVASCTEAKRLIGQAGNLAKHWTERELQEAQEREKQFFKNAQLFSVLWRSIPGFERLAPGEESYGKCKQKLSELLDDDLGAASDPDAHLDGVDRLLTSMPLSGANGGSGEALGSRQELLQSWVNRIAKEAQYYSQQIRKHREELVESVHLREVPPSLGIFRGLIGGDCSTKYSFPYPNDPHEHVFVVSDQTGARKGIVSTTIVQYSQPQLPGAAKSKKHKGLYAVTIAGQKLTAADTELIFRGLSKARKELRWESQHGEEIDRVLLPEKSKVGNLINFFQIAGIYRDHLAGQKSNPDRTVLLDHQDASIREDLERFVSKNNGGNYDHRSNNRRGIFLDLDENPAAASEVEVRVHSRPVEPIHPKKMSFKELTSFALEQHALNRGSVVDAVLATESVKAVLTPQRFAQLVGDLENGANPVQKEAHGGMTTPVPSHSYLLHRVQTKTLRVSEFLARARKTLHEIGIPEASYSDSHPIFYKGRLQSPDAFSPENLKITVEVIAADLKRNLYQPAAGLEGIGSKRDKLFHHESFQPVLKKIQKDLISADEQSAQIAAYVYLIYLLPDSAPLGQFEGAAVQKLVPLFDAFQSAELLCTLRFNLLGRTQDPSWNKHKKALETRLFSLVEDLPLSEKLKVLSSLSQLKAKTPERDYELFDRWAVHVKDSLLKVAESQLHQAGRDQGGQNGQSGMMLHQLIELEEKLLNWTTAPLNGEEKQVLQKWLEKLAEQSVSDGISQGQYFEPELKQARKRWNPVVIRALHRSLETWNGDFLDALADKKANLDSFVASLAHDQEVSALRQAIEEKYRVLVLQTARKMGPRDSQPFNWVELAKILERLPPGSAFKAELREAMKHGPLEMLKEIRYGGGVVVLAEYLLNPGRETEFPEEARLVREKLGVILDWPLSGYDFRKLHEHFSKKQFPGDEASLERLNTLYPQLVSTIDTYYAFRSTAEHLVGVFPHGDAQKHQILRDRLLWLLSNQVDEASEGEFLQQLETSYAREWVGNHVPDLGEILRLKDLGERRALIEVRYPGSACSAQQIHEFTKILKDSGKGVAPPQCH